MIHSYYNKQKLQQADDSYLSFGISINLLDSAFNILQHPIDLLKNEKGNYYRSKSISEYELIACFQSVSTALELILKSIIALKSWKYLFANPKRVARNNLINGEFRSINFDNCIKQIEAECGIKIDDRLKNRIETIRVIRNKIAHYYLDFTQDELITYIAFGLDIFIELYRIHVKDEIFDEDDRTKSFEEELSDIHQFVEVRIESAKANKNHKFSLLKPSLNTECQKCLTTNLVLTESHEIQCLYCGSIVDIEIYADYHCDFDEDPTICPKCHRQTVINMNSKASCIFCEIITK